MPESARPRTVLWQKCRRGEIEEAARVGGVALLPTGAVEQHGPHLPLDTDSFTAFTICQRAAARVTEFPVLVLPPIWWGLSPFWMGFPGTLTLKAETLVAIIVELAACVRRHGFRQMVLVNGHGGNDGLIQAAAIKAGDHDIQVAAVSYWNLIRDTLRALSERDDGAIGHAGELETSIQFYLQPDCVSLDAMKAGRAVDVRARTDRLGPVAENIYLPPDPAAEFPDGIVGMPEAATAEKGRKVVEAAADHLAQLVRRLGRAATPQQ